MKTNASQPSGSLFGEEPGETPRGQVGRGEQGLVRAGQGEPQAVPEVDGSEAKAAARKEATQSRFERFYTAYPRRVGRGAALKAFEKLKPDDDLLKEMILAIQAQIRSRKQRQDAKEFIPDWPHPATWLNGQRWLDELPSSMELKAKAQADERKCKCGRPAVCLADNGPACARCFSFKHSLEGPTGVQRLNAKMNAMGLSAVSSKAECLSALRARNLTALLPKNVDISGTTSSNETLSLDDFLKNCPEQWEDYEQSA